MATQEERVNREVEAKENASDDRVEEGAHRPASRES